MERKVAFPQVSGLFTLSNSSSPRASSGTRDLLLVCGGRFPSSEWFLETAQGRELHCADSGGDLCRRENLLPASFVGDGDSVDPETLEWLQKKGVPLEILPREKDYTDYQVLLHRMASLGESVRTMVVTGIWGGRFDHLYSALGTSEGFLVREKIPLFAFGDSEEVLFFLCSGESLELSFAQNPWAFSLLSLSESCQGVTSGGTKWDLGAVTLSRHCPYAISNEIVWKGEGGLCTVAVERGVLGVYAWWR